MRCFGPYNLSQGLRWVARFCFGPTRRHRHLHPSSPRWIELDPSVQPQLQVALAGDLMSTKGRRIRFEPEVRAFLAGCDWLVLNLEGVLASKRDLVLVKQYSSDSLLDDLAELLPAEKLVLSLGNNHAADYGPDELQRTVAKIRGQGSQVVGTREQPSLRLHPKVGLHAATTLSNQPGDFVAWLEDAVPDPDLDLNLLFLHWGEEFVAYPGPEQIQRGRDLLARWDALVGHHSHCPGPVGTVSKEGRERVLMHSLGNFVSFFTAPVVRHGILARLDLGPDPRGRWGIAALEWNYCWLSEVTREEIRVGLREDCPVM